MKNKIINILKHLYLVFCVAVAIGVAYLIRSISLGICAGLILFSFISKR
jgi:hypothetical protein